MFVRPGLGPIWSRPLSIYSMLMDRYWLKLPLWHRLGYLVIQENSKKRQGKSVPWAQADLKCFFAVFRVFGSSCEKKKIQKNSFVHPIPSSIHKLKKLRFFCLQKCDPHSILVTLGHRRSRLHKFLVELVPLLHFTTPVGHKATVHPHQPESQHVSFRRIMTHWICTTDNSIISGVNS